MSNESTTIIASDASFKGELSFEQALRLEGRFEGQINTSGSVHITEGAKMAADCTAGQATIEGDVSGNLRITGKLELKGTARYQGDLQAAQLVVTEGARLSGHVNVGVESVVDLGDEDDAEQTPAKAQAA